MLGTRSVARDPAGGERPPLPADLVALGAMVALAPALALACHGRRAYGTQTGTGSHSREHSRLRPRRVRVRNVVPQCAAVLGARGAVTRTRWGSVAGVGAVVGQAGGAGRRSRGGAAAGARGGVVPDPMA